MFPQTMHKKLSKQKSKGREEEEKRKKKRAKGSRNEMQKSFSQRLNLH
jgi:hypothetical protein